ncbi:MAG: hypothetical protein ABL994_03650, partial [Verrucomicrobiales bacterium]
MNTPSPLASQQEILRQFPTPLAELFEKAMRAEDRRSWVAWFLGETIRFLALVALQDSLTHRLFASGGDKAEEALANLRQPMLLGKWTALLRSACVTPEVAAHTRFITDAKEWGEMTRESGIISKLVSGRNDWAHHQPPLDPRDTDLADSLLENLQVLYARLGFL